MSIPGRRRKYTEPYIPYNIILMIMPKVYSEVLGEYIDIPDDPRIVSLAPSITDTLHKIKAWGNVVGVSLYCNIPREAAGKPRVGAYLKVSYKKLDELEPDLILTTTGVQRRLTMELRDKGYTVYPIPLPISIYGIIDNIVLTGYAVGKVDEAYRVAREYLDKLRSLEPPLHGSVYYEICFEEPYTIGKYSYINSSLAYIGLKNIFMEIEASYFKPDMDKVLEANPGIILYEMNPAKRPEKRDVIKMLLDRGWGELDAVKNDRVIILEPDTLAHYGPTHIENLIKIYNTIRDIR